MRLDEKLAALRERKGLSQMELAEEMDISRQAVSRWEVGSAVPSVENLKQLSRLYGVSVDVLLDETRTLEEETAPPEREEEAGGRTGKKRTWCLVLIAAMIVIGIFVSVRVYMAAMGEKDPLPIKEMEGRVVEPDRERDFDLEW